MRPSDFSCFERFSVEEIPRKYSAKAVAELTEIPDVSWLQTSLHFLAGDGLE